MEVNIEKTKIVHFRNKRRRKTKFEFKIDNCTLDIDNSYRYLGVILILINAQKLYQMLLAELWVL